MLLLPHLFIYLLLSNTRSNLIKTQNSGTSRYRVAYRCSQKEKTIKN